MAWLRLDDGFFQHPKFEGWKPGQKWAFAELMGYCAKYRTGGRIPVDLALLPRSVTQGLLDLAERSGWLDRDSENGLVIHDWSVYNPKDPTAAERMQRLRDRNSDRNSDRNEDVTGTVTAPVTEPSPRVRARADSRPLTQHLSEDETSSERRADLLWDILADELGEPATDSERGRRNKALKELRAINATEEELRQRIATYRREWPDITITATAIAANWTELGRGAGQARPMHDCPYCPTSFPFADELESHLVDWHATEKAKV